MSTTNDECAAQVRYWRNALHGTNYPSLNTLMLLDPDGEAYADEEVVGTLSLLPPVPRAAIPGERPPPVPTLTSQLPFRKHPCDNTALT
jgi:hypothetical protein